MSGDYKYIYGQSSSTYSYCGTERKYSIKITITSSTVTFYDDVCGTLTLSDTLGASQFYIYVGADDDLSYGEDFYWLGVDAPLPTPTPSVTYAPTAFELEYSSSFENYISDSDVSGDGVWKTGVN